MRGLAVAAVLCFHSELSWARGGFLGVSAFFTLSGFLITSLLLAEHATSGTIRLGSFWVRRARRLLPASYAALGGIVLFGAVVADGDQVRHLRGDVLSALGYVANWRFLLDGRSYSDLFRSPSPVQHFWSLAIEEQYYLLFPLVVAGVMAIGRGRRWLLGVALSALALSAVAISLLVGTQDRVYYGTDTRAPELLAGALLAVVAAGRAAPTRRSTIRLLDAAGLGALAAMLVLWSRTAQGDAWLYKGGFALHALLTTVVITAGVYARTLPRLLEWAPLRALGSISYGVYLYHWPVFLWLDGERTGLAAAPLLAARAAVTLAAAALSYRFLEQPIRSRRMLTGRPRMIAAPALAAVLVVAAVAVTADPPPQTIVFEAVGDAPPQGPAPGPPAATRIASHADPLSGGHDSRLHRRVDENRPLRVMIVGDSVAQTLGRGLERWSADTGRAQVWNVAHRWCGIGRYAARALGRGVESPGAACDDWADRWAEQIREFDPDTVIVLSTIWELVARRLSGWPDFRTPGDPVYDTWITSEYTTAADVLGDRGAKVVWLELPCTRDAPAEERETVEHYNDYILPELARRRPGKVELVGFFSRVCPDGRFTSTLGSRDGARPDGVHFSETGADWAAGWLMPMVTGGAGAAVGH